MTDKMPEEYIKYTGHGSICYAFEWTGLKLESQEIVLTSSFYDSTLKLICM